MFLSCILKYFCWVNLGNQVYKCEQNICGILNTMTRSQFTGNIINFAELLIWSR